MKLISRLTLFTIPVVASMPVHGEESHYWPLESIDSASIVLHGRATVKSGAAGRCLALDGGSVVEAKVPDPAGLHGEYTIMVWVNPYALNRDQQMIMAKNQYSLNQREWSVMIDRDGSIRLYVYQKGWVTTAGPRPKPGQWHQIGLVIKSGRAELFVNGSRVGSIDLKHPVASTDAPLTFGGVNDNGNLRQTLLGAIDEATLIPRALTAEEIAALYKPVTSTHTLPKIAPPFPLWDSAFPLHTADTLPELSDVEFHVIKKWDQPRDGYTFLHGVGLSWHKGRLFASFGHNKGEENTVSEEAQYRVSEDAGATWGPLQVIDAGEEKDLAVSHGVFLSHNDSLWAFHGAYYNHMERIHTRAYKFDEAANEWKKLGVVLREGFWPMNQPVRMSDGNWIMPGFLGKRYSGDKAFPAAVAISHGDDFSKWDLVPIPVGKTITRMWGESSLYVDGKTIINIARYGGAAMALAAKSTDFGRTWLPSVVSNLPMTTSKPAAGILSNGQRYLVCTTAKNNGGNRSPLTIAVSRPGENKFSKVFVIRRSMLKDQPGESAERLSLSYPYAIEHNGQLYVGFSNNGGRRANLNSAELAVIPIERLRTD